MMSTDDNTFRRVDWSGDKPLPGDNDDEHGMPLRPQRGPGLSSADLELLTLAAHALGATVEVVEGEQWVALHFADGTISHGWNPLRHSDDTIDPASRLSARDGGVAILLNSRFDQIGFATVYTDEHHVSSQEWMLDDPKAAILRAITRAAAEIGRAMAPRPGR
jgi:hypothetical protein